jgi:hypothetical protein
VGDTRRAGLPPLRSDGGRPGPAHVSGTGPEKRLVGFGETSERFLPVHGVTSVIPHVMFHSNPRSMWHGTDSNRLGPLASRSVEP